MSSTHRVITTIALALSASLAGCGKKSQKDKASPEQGGGGQQASGGGSAVKAHLPLAVVSRSAM